MKFWANFICLLLLAAACQRDATLPEEESDLAEIPTSLPKQDLSLENLSAFVEPSTGWRVVGNVSAVVEKQTPLEVEEGQGVLAFLVEDTKRHQLATQLQHGDLEMDLQFLLPKGGEAQLWLQGRYAIQLQDTWKQSLRTSGMLLGPTATDNETPPVNACRAPGLWQELSLYFEAPRFDDEGNKVSNAKIHYLKLNGYTLFEEVELTGPSADAPAVDEVAQAALVFASLSGEVAFRHIKYKAYSLNQLQVNNIQYKMYQGDWDTLPTLDTLTAAQSGTQETFGIEIEGVKDKYALAFSGQLEVPVAGQYLFETHIDDGGDLQIDGELVVHNDGDPGGGTERGLVELTQGTHTIDLTYYQDVWGRQLLVFYEGPSIKRQLLGAKEAAKSGGQQRDRLVINPSDGPELIRSFVQHKGVKRNFPISVGSPLGTHYTYDLEEGTLLQAWRGEFADVTDMWVGRGHSQLLVPGNASIQATAGIAVATLASVEASWPQMVPQGFQMKGYDLNADGYPVFLYQYEDLRLQDQILPTSDGNIERQIELVDGQAGTKHYFRLAQGQVEALESGWYRIDGAYYIEVAEAMIGGVEQDQLLVPLAGKQRLSYRLIW